jgi:hypothetical protein
LRATKCWLDPSWRESTSGARLTMVPNSVVYHSEEVARLREALEEAEGQRAVGDALPHQVLLRRDLSRQGFQ